MNLFTIDNVLLFCMGVVLGVFIGVAIEDYLLGRLIRHELRNKRRPDIREERDD